jgi:hypothetical protein
MSLNLEVGKVYAAKTYLENGYNFPEGEYKLKIIHDGFPEDPINQEEELVIAEEQWLEGLEETEQYQVDLNSNWYYFKFPENDDNIEYMWIPKSIVKDVFKLNYTVQ